MIPRIAAVTAVALLSVTLPLADVEREQLSLELILHPDAKIDVSGRSLSEFVWLDEEAAYLERIDDDDGEPLRIDKVAARSGRRAPLLTRREMTEAFGRLPGFDGDGAERLAKSALAAALASESAPGRAGEARFAPDRASVLVNGRNDLFLYRLAERAATRLTHDTEPEVGEEFSPDGRMVSFLRAQNLYVLDLADGRERALTDGGSPELLFGRLDWVYQEELYGRGNYKGYWWSPDSTRIALLRLDESPVGRFTVIDHMPTRLGLEVTNYPKAGDPNPAVALGVVDVAGGELTWIDTSRYAADEHLIVRVDWSVDGRSVVYQVQDREQTWLDLNLAPLADGEPRTLLREQSPTSVEALGSPLWLDDGSFLWLSARSGFPHLEHRDANGTLTTSVTTGRWEVRALHGYDPRGGWVYFTSTEHSPIEEHLYRVRLDGTRRSRLTSAAGSHQVELDPAFRFVLDSWSDVRTPPKLLLHAADGSSIRTIDENSPTALDGIELGQIRFMQVPARDGFVMEAAMITPPDFDPSRKYPVLQYNYGGPHAPVVRNVWQGVRMLWHLLLAQKGYIVWMCDNRSASGKGVEPIREVYGRMGFVELRDIEDGLAWLKGQPYVDGSRIGIWGWSYGGYMTLFALTHGNLFKIGIAGAPVTDWRLYDTIYTERYMKRPQNNSEGYAETSLLTSAKNLEGRLLLIHGTMDDNVHLQNSIQLIYELQKAGKRFDLMLYPNSRHGVVEPALTYHLYAEMTRFIEENL